MAKEPPQPKTIEITNFGGRLSRIINGELNSGFAKFLTSWGYDPFSKPGNLTWLEQPVNISPTTVNHGQGLVLDSLPRSEQGQEYIYALAKPQSSLSGLIYKIQPNSVTNPNVDSVIGISSLAGANVTFNYGGSMAFFNYANSSVLGKIYVGSDFIVDSINTDGTAEASIAGTFGLGGYVDNTYRPIIPFAGKLIFGNQRTIAAIDSTNTVISPTLPTGSSNPSSIYSQLNPLLPPETYITDLDVSPDGNYLLISTSGTLNEQPTNFGGANIGALAQTNATGGNLYQWNGSDLGATAVNFLGSFTLTALQAYLQNNMLFMNDAFGAALSDGVNKILTMPQNKSPFANATAVNGNFITWVVPEANNQIEPAGMHASLYYFGNLDNENQPGLWRVMKYYGNNNGYNVAQVPYHKVINSNSFGLNASASSVVTMGYGKHYFSTLEENASETQANQLNYFLITPTGSGAPQFGYYETQSQIFSKKITIKEIRFYTEPTIVGNKFLCSLIGSNGNPINNTLGSGFLEYTYAAGTDPTLAQGALDRIKFNPTTLDTYVLGLRIQNVGSTNMTFHKIEIDYQESGN